MIENQHTEFKTSWRDEYIRYVSAFSNAKGGVLYLGVDDSGKTVGLENAIKLLETLPNLINQKTGILPLIELKQEENKQFIVIVIHASIVPISYHGHYYIRSGSITTEIQGAQLNEFLLKRTGCYSQKLHDNFHHSGKYICQQVFDNERWQITR